MTGQPVRPEHDGPEFQLFGRFAATWGGVAIGRLEGRKVQELASYLLLFRGRPHNREILADALWGELAPAQSRKYLRQTLWHLQASMGSARRQESLLVADPEWIQVNPACPLWLDTAELEAALARIRDVPGAQIDDVSARALTRAVDLYWGDLLEGWYQDWCVYERERLRTIYLAALEKLLEYCQVQGRAEEGLQYGRLVLRHDPAHERTHRRMMRLHWMAGDRTGAIRQFEACVSYLQRELGVGPAESTVALLERIRNDDLPSPLDPPSQGPLELGAVASTGSPAARPAALVPTLHLLRSALSDAAYLVERTIRILQQD